MLSVKHIVFSIAETDLGFVRNALVKALDNAFHTLALKLPLVVLAGSDYLAGVKHHHLIQGNRCRHNGISLLRIVSEIRIRCESIF